MLLFTGEAAASGPREGKEMTESITSGHPKGAQRWESLRDPEAQPEETNLQLPVARAEPEKLAPAGEPVSTGRRGMLLGMAAAGAGIGLGVLGHPEGTAFAADASPSTNPTGPIDVKSTTSTPAVTATNTSTGSGVYGVNGSTSGTGYGVEGTSRSPDGSGVVGHNAATSGQPVGVEGDSASPNGAGVYGHNLATSGLAVGVQGTSRSPDGSGVAGRNPATSGTGNGVNGTSASPTGSGVYGTNTAASEGYGVYGHASSASGLAVVGVSTGALGAAVYGNATGKGSAGVFADGSSGAYALQTQGDAQIDGSLAVSGSLSKGGGSFKIDHPLDPAGKYLYHSFVESPDMMNVYAGTITLDDDGRATVALPEWFEALNRDFHYQLTAIGGPAPDLHVSGEIRATAFSIAGGRAGQKVCWQVTGVRHDSWANANRIPVEADKAAEDQGRYLHPELFGPKANGIMANTHRPPSYPTTHLGLRSADEPVDQLTQSRYLHRGPDARKFS